MAGGNSTISCSHLVSSFHKSMQGKIWLVNALQLAGAILAGLIVGIGIYGQRYRHHRLTRFIFLGTNTLFLAIISTVVPMGAGENAYATEPYDLDNGEYFSSQLIFAKCQPSVHSLLVVVWAPLVQIIMINTSAVVAVDGREGGSMGPPFELFVKGVWTFYLGISYIILLTNRYRLHPEYMIARISLEVVTFALIFTKMVLKYYAFEKARQSFALGRNPHLISGYMKQQSSQQTSHHGELVVVEDAPPPLLVMGEEKRHVEKQPLGYVFKDDSWTSLHNNGLVTIDRVWRLDNMLPTSTLKPQKDLCFSFALFKLLRCRFARYKVRNNAGSKDAFSFFWSLLLKDGERDRVFLVISDELWFLHDYYYSSLPIYYSNYWLPILGIFISLLSLYKDIKKDAERVLAGYTAGGSLTLEARCQRLIKTLAANAKHEVLKEGARLGEQLVELMVVKGEDVAVWKLMAEFWSEMILYVAPSDNLNGHKEAIARGGELIRLLWVLLFHAGIVSKPGEEDGAAATSAGAV
ncbi:uncharacterized protein LOC120659570 [Panicum virgatum]|uniref:uncharacterized protein LOC120659570 n=1 Tax=Panicum virgatum TaxID=38727 RepID=UPI0019D594DA|nr:uncharacterized protein LOC120659570 [Panicum virgatum]